MPAPLSNFSRYPIPSDLDPDGICCITVPVPNDRQWIAQFMGALWRMSLQTHYERDPAKSGKVVAARWRQVWREVQTMACCGQSQSDVNIELNSKRVQNFALALTWKQIWLDATSTVSVAYYEIPTTYSTDPADAGDEVAQREQALCLAIQGWVNEVMNYMESWMISNFEEALAGLGGAGVAIGAATGLSFWPVVIMLGIPTALVLDIFLQLRSKDYRQYIMCRMFENLLLKDPDVRSDWDAALDAESIPRPLPESIFQDAARDLIETYLRSQINNLDNYLMFAGQLGTAMDVARAGAVDCPCTGEWEHAFLEGNGLQELVINNWPVGQDPAVYDPIDDLIDGTCLGIPDGGLFSLAQLAFESRVITKVRLHVRYTSTRASPTDNLVIWNGVMGVGDNLASIGVSGTDDVVLSTGDISVASTLLNFEVVIAISNSVCPDDSGGVSEIVGIIVNGQGTDPFE